MILVSDLQYFPSVIFFLELSKFSNCKFELYDSFQKASFRNRCMVMGGNGPIQLSIPVLGGRTQKTIMKDVRVDNRERWKDRHWKTITSCYNKSPWFDFYRDELEGLYLVHHHYLFDWNFSCIQWICDKMSIATSLSTTSGYQENYDIADYIDRRNYWMPSTIHLLQPHPKRYPQVFEDRYGFVPNLSVLDYLFCSGNKIDADASSY